MSNRLSAAAALLVMLSACGGREAKPSTFVYRADHPHVLGAPIAVMGSWSASCTSWSAVFANETAKSDTNPQLESYKCDEKPVALTVECSAACTQQKGTQRRTVVVIPQTVGTLTIVATNRRIDTGEVAREELSPINIVMPHRLELRCASEARGQNTAPCGPEGVPANNPTLEGIAFVDDQAESSALLQANGVPIPLQSDEAKPQRISLLELYPDARDADGIKPGTYPVTLTLGTVTSTWQVVAR